MCLPLVGRLVASLIYRSEVPDSAQIRCVKGFAGGVCAFLQNSGGVSGQSIKALAHYIPDHGCNRCGSVPLFFSDANNVANGELTFDFVTSSAYDGVC
ncbi:Kp4-domain-containing protein [Mycena vulgaris]|nr:Kp4-domain-containing protein [Mycena vulgaris]